MKCLNISNPQIKKLADKFGEIITSASIDKWEHLGNEELPTIEDINDKIKPLILDVLKGKDIIEAHDAIQKELLSDTTLTTKERLRRDVLLEKEITRETNTREQARKQKEAIKKIEDNPDMAPQEIEDAVDKLREGWSVEKVKMLIGDGEQKAEVFKEKLKETYTNVKGYENDFDTERALTNLAKGGTFEEHMDENIEKMYEEGLKEKDDKKINLAKRLASLKEGQRVSLFNFFHSSQNVSYTKMLINKFETATKQIRKTISLKLSNNGMEQELIKIVTDKLSKISDETYVRLYDRQRKTVAANFNNDALYLQNLTGIPIYQWAIFVDNPTFNHKLKPRDKILRDFVVYSSGRDENKQDVRVDTKQKFIDNLTKAKRKNAGSIINTISINSSFAEQSKFMLNRFKNTVWNLKSSLELDSHLINRFEKVSEESQKDYTKMNKWVQLWSSKTPKQTNIDGIFFSPVEGNYTSQEAGKLADNDLRSILIENYKATEDTYMQNTGQYGDKDKLHLIEAKKHTNYEQLKKDYSDLLMSQGATEVGAKAIIVSIERDSKKFATSENFPTNTDDNAKLFALNYAYNFNMINEYLNGDNNQYGTKDKKTGKWKTAPIIELFKRNGSTASPGMYLNKYVKGGLGKGFNYAVINIPKIAGFKALDGQSYITRAHSDATAISSGSIFNFNTSIKAITSFVKDGTRYLDKTNSIVLDDFAEKFPDSFEAKLLAFMNANGLSKVSTLDGAKFPGKLEVYSFFKEGTTEINPHVVFTEEQKQKHITEIKTEDYLVQQDLVNDGTLYESSTPIQRTKNMIHDQAAEMIASLFNEVGSMKMKEMSDKINMNDKETWKNYILEKLGFSKQEIEDIDDIEKDEQGFSDLDEIEKLLVKGVSMQHPWINPWLAKYVANVITKQALGRITNKGLAVEMAYMKSNDFKLKDYREEDGRIHMPESAVPYNSKLRAPSKPISSKSAAIKLINDNPNKYRDMFIGFDNKGNPIGIHEHEIEVSKDGTVIIPGELHLITRIPADNMHSHTLARVKYVFPKGMKNTIITNHQSQDISGADFDGDQRTIEGFFKNTQGQVSVTGKSKHSLANAALHQQMQWYYNKENMETVLMPIDTDFFKSDLEKLDITNPQPQRTKDSPETFIDARKKNNVGLAVVGMMANLQSAYDFLRKHNSTIKQFTNELKDKQGNVIKEEIKDWLSFPTIKDGKVVSHKTYGAFEDSNSIKNIIGNLLNLSLDNVKSPKIERLGLNEVTVKMFVPALMQGMNKESVIAFFNTPTVKRFVEEVRQTNNVESTDDVETIFNKLANLNNPKNDSKISTRKDQEMVDSDLTNPMSMTILRKLKVMYSMGFEFDKINSVIKLTEQAPKSWVDYMIAKANYNTVINNGLTFIDTKSFDESVFITPAGKSLDVSKDYFSRFGNEHTAEAKLLHDEIVNVLNYGNETDRDIVLNRDQLAAFAKAVNSMMLMISRGRSTKFRNWKKDVLADFEKYKTEGKYPAILSALQIEETKGNKVISLREDIKRNEIDATELKVIRAEFDEMMTSKNPEDVKFAKDLIDYNVFQYEMASSTFKGSYANLFSTNIHKDIDKEQNEVYDMFKNGKLEQGQRDSMFREITEKNIILTEPKLRKEEVVEEERQKIYEPFASTKYGIVMGEKQIKKFEALSLGTDNKLEVGTTGVNKGVLDGVSGEVIEFTYGDKTISREIESVEKPEKNQVPNSLVVTFKPVGVQKKESQQQKQSQSNNEYNKEVLKRLKKAFPGIEVIEDENVNAAGELDADGKTIRINPNYAKLDTPIHEYAHVLIDALGGTSNTFIAQGVDQLKGSDLWNKTKERYPNLSDDMLAKEVLAEAIGREGANIFKQQEKKSKFKNWMDMLFFKLKMKLGLERNVAKSLAYDLLSGRKISKEIVTTGIKQQQKITPKSIVDALSNVKSLFTFDEATHTYKFNGKIFSSTTTTIDGIEEYGYTGETKEEYNINSTLGREVHKVLEDIINGKSFDEISKGQIFTDDNKVFKDIHDHFTKLVTKLNKSGTVMTEVVIGNTKNELAGTVDIIVVQKDGSIKILDLKTSIHPTSDVDVYTNHYVTPGGIVKKSKADKHGIQMATYGKALSMGDTELGIPPLVIDTLEIIPVHITITDGKISGAIMEDLINVGYGKYAPETMYTLPLQPIMEEKKILDPQEAKFYKTKHMTRQSWAQVKYEGFNFLRADAEIGKLKQELVAAEGSMTLSVLGRDEEVKRLTKAIKKIQNRGIKLDEEYAQYEKDFDIMVNFYKNEDITSMNVQELLGVYEAMTKLDVVAAKQLMDDTKLAIAKHLMQNNATRQALLNPKLSSEPFSQADMAGMDPYMKSISVISEQFPEIQEFAKQYFETVMKMNVDLRKIQDTMESNAKVIIAEYNKKHGIIKSVSHFINPFSNNQRYFSFIEKGDTGTRITPSDSEYNSLTEAQKNMIKTIDRYFKDFKNELFEGAKPEGDYLAKVTSTFGENKENSGFWTAATNYFGSGNFRQRGAILKLTPSLVTKVKAINANIIATQRNGKPKYAEDFLTFGEIESIIQGQIENKEISRVSGLLEIRSLKKRADVVISNARHENKDTYKVDSGSLYEMNAHGQIRSKFHHKKSKNMRYSKDFYRASLHLFVEMNFIRHMQPMIPLLESVETYSKSLGATDGVYLRKNTLKFLDIWKRGNILHDNNLDPHIPGVIPVLKNLRLLTHLSVMAFATTANVFNVAIGKYNQFRGDMPKNFGNGELRYWSNFKKTQTILKKYNALSFEVSLKPRTTIGDVFNMIAYGGTKLGENWIQGGGVIGQLTDEEFSWFDNDGTVNDKGLENISDATLYNQAYKKRINDLNAKMVASIDNVARIQGRYRNEDRRNFAHFELGRAAFQFKIWIPEALADRFSGVYYDYNGVERQGTLNAAWKSGIRALKELYKKETLTPSTEQERTLHYRVMRSAMAMISVSAIIAMSGGDDDEDKWILKQANRLSSDMGMIGFGSASAMAKTPFAFLSTLAKIIALMDAIFYQRTYKSKTKYHKKGDSMIPTKAIETLPYKKVIKYLGE